MKNPFKQKEVVIKKKPNVVILEAFGLTGIHKSTEAQARRPHPSQLIEIAWKRPFDFDFTSSENKTLPEVDFTKRAVFQYRGKQDNWTPIYEFVELR